MTERADVHPKWLDPTPGSIAEADQIKARMIDALRESEVAVMFCEGPTEGRRVYACAIGNTGELKEFFLHSLRECLTHVSEATGIPERILVAGLVAAVIEKPEEDA